MDLAIDFQIGTATELPWPDASVDICLAPELLEHVPEWQTCLDELSRILRPGGLLYINTSNSLCPVQNEFKLPMYSWYPRRLKRLVERLSVSTHPELANYATYPAVNWFTFPKLRREFERRGLVSFDRVDLFQSDDGGFVKRNLIPVIRASAMLRLMVQFATPYTQIVGLKS